MILLMLLIVKGHLLEVYHLLDMYEILPSSSRYSRCLTKTTKTKGRYVTISLAQSYKSCTWLTTRFGLHEVHRPQEKNRENYVFRRILKYYVWLEREQNWLSNGLFLFVAKLLSSK